MGITSLVVSIVIAEGAGLIGSVFTAKSVKTWYQTLNRPGWNPPSSVFAPVWTLLYALMGVAAYLVYVSGSTLSTTAISVYAGHLVLNVLWSILFFGLQNPKVAFIEICLLWCSIVLTTYLFWQISVWAGVLLLPYLAWVTFASALNFQLWQLNK